MKRCLTLFPIYFICLFSSCTPCSTKKIPCDAFNEPVFFKWFPYHITDRLSFKNINNSDSFSYVIAQVDTSKAYETQQGGYGNNAYSCFSSAYITNINNGIPDDIFHIQYSITRPFDNSPMTKYLELYFKNTTWAVTEITESGFTNNSSGNNNIATTVVNQNNVLFDNGITYPVVTALSLDTAGITIEKPYKIFIAKNIGIIGFEMYPSLQKWVIQ
jgi:hypothetical protein